jgi:small-conductance mechanosensitive channel
MDIDWNQEYWNNTLQDYILTFGLALASAVILWSCLYFAGRHIRKINQGRRLTFALISAALRSVSLFLFSLSFSFLYAQQLEWTDEVYPWLNSLFFITIIIHLLIAGNRALSAWAERYDSTDLTENGARLTTIRLLIFLGRLTVFSLGFLIIVDQIPGVNLTALVASLGVGGIAVALALQNILADLFASLTISLDKPFLLGDFIKVDGFLGVVEKVGLKTTRIRSLAGEQLIFSNNDLLSSRIQNYKRMQERRVAFTIGVTYDTPPDKLRRIPGKVREIVEDLEDTRFDRAHFKSHGSYSLDFEIVYYVHGPDYNLYMDRQQAINLAIHEYFSEIEVDFAFPTQTLHLYQGVDPEQLVPLAIGSPEAKSSNKEAEARSP